MTWLEDRKGRRIMPNHHARIQGRGSLCRTQRADATRHLRTTSDQVLGTVACQRTDGSAGICNVKNRGMKGGDAANAPSSPVLPPGHGTDGSSTSPKASRDQRVTLRARNHRLLRQPINQRRCLSTSTIWKDGSEVISITRYRRDARTLSAEYDSAGERLTGEVSCYSHIEPNESNASWRSTRYTQRSWLPIKPGLMEPKIWPRLRCGWTGHQSSVFSIHALGNP